MNAKVIVITGASSGIGAELARQLGRGGHYLVLGARREPELRQSAQDSGERAIAVVCDVRRRADVEHLKTAAIDEFGHVDVWINNAGRGIGRKVMDLTDEEFDEIMSINLKSAWYGMQVIIPHFQERGKGHLINISTFLSRVPLATYRSVYNAPKSALNILTANLRMDLKAEYPEIHVSLVLPGVVTTEFAKHALGGTPQTARPGGGVKPQSVEEAARAIASLIENPQPELYTNQVLAEIVSRYYQDVGAFEEKAHQGS